MRISIAVVCLSAAACAPAVRSAAPAAPVEAKKVETLEWKGAHGPEAMGHEIAADPSSWQAAWRKILGEDAPALDFTRYVGVVVAAGRRMTGGWGFTFTTEAKGDDLAVHCKITKPTGFVTQAITEPWRAKAFPRPKGRLTVEVESE